MEDQVIARCEFRDAEGGKIEARLYNDGTVIMKNENGDMIALDPQQQRLLRRMLPED